LPLIPSTHWAIRVWDFPRLQLLALAVLSLLLLVAAAGWADKGPFELLVAGLLIAAIAFLIFRIAPYTPLSNVEVARATQDGEKTVRLLVANVRFSNHLYSEVSTFIRDSAADLVLLIEINHAWRDALEEIAAEFPHRLEEVREEGCGITLWSRHPLRGTEVRYIVSQTRPSLHADIALAGGDVGIICLHPIPPGLPKKNGDRHDSDKRDAELLLVANEVARNPDKKWLIAGDLNDVAWSPTTRLFKKISGLHDPRLGRGFFNTYHARHPLLRYPVDHVFLSPGAKVGLLERKSVPGSDHFGMFVSLQF